MLAAAEALKNSDQIGIAKAETIIAAAGQTPDHLIEIGADFRLHAAGAESAGAIENGDEFAVGGGADGEAIIHGRVDNWHVAGNILPENGDAGHSAATGVRQRRAGVAHVVVG